MCTVLLPPGVNPTAFNKYIYLKYDILNSELLQLKPTNEHTS